MRVVDADKVGLRLREGNRVMQRRILLDPIIDVAHPAVVSGDGPVRRPVEIRDEIGKVGTAELDVDRGVLEVVRGIERAVDQALVHHILGGLGHKLHKPARALAGLCIGVPSGLGLDYGRNQIGVDPVGGSGLSDLLLIF